MRLVFGLVLLAGIGLAGFAVYMAQNYIGAYETALVEARQQTHASVPTRQIYVSANPIAYGQEITEEDIRLAPWPEEIMPEGIFDEENPLLTENMEPRVALRAIDAFEAIVPSKVSQPGGSAGLTHYLKPGESAFAIRVDVASGVSGFLRPGDRVDVYWTGRVDSRDPNMPRGEVTKMILAGMRLIAIDQNSEADTSGTSIARTVTVAATREQTLVLTHAQSTGQLTLSLISQDEDGEAITTEVDQLSMLGLQRAEPVAAPEPVQREQVCSTRVRRGAEVVNIPIPCTN